MKLELASLNFKNSSISERERLAFSEEEIRRIIHEIKKDKSVSGCVLLATCNRTEIYLSRRIDKPEMDDIYGEEEEKDRDITAEKSVGELLLEAAGISDFKGSFETKEGRDVAFYLSELASGLKSQILGEGQIVTQINNAWDIARNEKCTDSVLNVLFRNAVSAGKKVLTNVKISGVPLSSAYAAFDLIMKHYKDISDKKALIIGNGNMGRLMQQLLYEKGCDVVVTIRGYAHGNNTVVEGCKKISYAERYEYMEKCDFVVSATRSPHRTVKPEKVKRLSKIPELMIDLAMPRDIDAAVGELCTVKNINELGFKTDVDEETLSRVYEIVEEAVSNFYHWYSYETSLEEIELLKGAMKKRLYGNFRNENIEIEQEEAVIELAVDKCVKMMIGGMHEFLDADKIKECRRKIEGRTRG